jgi:hypothetical protein
MVDVVAIFSMAIAASGLLAGSVSDVPERVMVIMPPTLVPGFFYRPPAGHWFEVAISKRSFRRITSC